MSNRAMIPRGYAMDGKAWRRRTRQSRACHSMAWHCVVKHCTTKPSNAASHCMVAWRDMAPDDLE
eukprot:6330912-Pyramimonas_sp.AAC.1